MKLTLAAAGVATALTAGTLSSALAQDEERGTILPVSGTVLDIESTVVDQGGARRNVQRGDKVGIRLSADVLFAFNKATLTPRARRVIDATAADVGDAEGPVRVEGHTDAKGAPGYNLKLSLRRARAVRAALAEELGDVTFAVQGYGERRPVAPNTRPDGRDYPRGRKLNRRVEVRFSRR